MKVILTQTGNRTFCGLHQEGRFLQIELCGGEDRQVGNLYVGRVQNVVPNIGAVFVEYQPGQVGYLAFSDCKNPVYSRKQSTSELPAPGDELLVEVIRDAIKTKQPALSGRLSFPGTYAVATYGNPITGISAQITAASERARLKRLAEHFSDPEIGWILRTAAGDAPEEEVADEMQKLLGLAHRLMEQAKHLRAFSCLRKNASPYLSWVSSRDLTRLEEVLTDLPEVAEAVQAELAEKGLSVPVRLWTEEVSLSSTYKVPQSLEHALSKRVWMNSGAYLVIEQTEACVVIDVNTGKAIHGKTAQEDTFLKINLEAARETARQIRLRNLSGILLVDFIDLNDSGAKMSLLEALKRYLAEDPVPCAFVDMTKLQLAEITRKKIRPSLAEQAEGLQTEEES